MKRLSISLIVLLGLVACGERGHAPYGEQELGSGAPSGGGGSEGQDFKSGCSDCFDVGPPSKPKEQSDRSGGGDDQTIEESLPEAGCGPDEVESSSTGTCWRRCPVGQDWDGSRCTGEIVHTDWFEAIAICATLDERYRTATRADLLSLLGPCPAEVVSGSGEGVCVNCRTSLQCSEMFGLDVTLYWSSSVGAGDFYDDPHPWAVSFLLGSFYISERPGDLFAVRCVRPGGQAT